jgi:transcriptional antiterminator RfaH
MVNNMHWYLVHTKPRQEQLALDNLQRQKYDCYLPTLPVEKIRQSSMVLVEEPLFPRYLFIRLGLDFKSQSWAPIRSTTGVSRLVRFGMEPAKVDDGLIETLREQESAFKAQPKKRFSAGDRVVITQGPFAGIEGVFQMASGEQRVMVLIELMSKPVTLPVAPNQLKSLG